jgi:hypothetical protein
MAYSAVQGDLDSQYESIKPSTDNTDYSYVYWVILIVAIIIVIYVYNTSANSDRKMADKYYKNLHGDAHDETAKKAIEYGNKIKNPTAMDSYRLGTAYLVNAKNPEEANKHFTKALYNIIERPEENKDAMFIVERIDEFKDRFVDHTELEDLPLQNALMATFQSKLNKASEDSIKKIPVDTKIISRRQWNSESQNVHDSSIYVVLKDQIFKARELNAKIPEIESKNYAYITNWLRMRYCDDAAKSHKIDQVLRILDSNYPTRSIPGITEQDVFVAAWRRSQDPTNASRMTQMYEAFGDAILDCVEGGNVVCIDGRISKIWQSLALLDNNKEMGIMRSKQMIRNEIYEKCAKAVRERLLHTNDEIRNAYNNPMHTSEQDRDALTADLVDQMRADIEAVGMEYKGKLDEKVLRGIIDECKTVV